MSMCASLAAWTISSSLTISSSSWLRSLSRRRARSLGSLICAARGAIAASRARSSLSRMIVSLTTATTRSTTKLLCSVGAGAAAPRATGSGPGDAGWAAARPAAPTRTATATRADGEAGAGHGPWWDRAAVGDGCLGHHGLEGAGGAAGAAGPGGGGRDGSWRPWPSPAAPRVSTWTLLEGVVEDLDLGLGAQPVDEGLLGGDPPGAVELVADLGPGVLEGPGHRLAMGGLLEDVPGAVAGVDRAGHGADVGQGERGVDHRPGHVGGRRPTGSGGRRRAACCRRPGCTARPGRGSPCWSGRRRRRPRSRPAAAWPLLLTMIAETRTSSGFWYSARLAS